MTLPKINNMNEGLGCFVLRGVRWYSPMELVANGIVSYYWTPDAGTSEIDFVVQGSRAVYPVEVKSATNTKAKDVPRGLSPNLETLADYFATLDFPGLVAEGCAR